MLNRHADVLIIGSGIAGLTAAELLSLEKNVIIITKSKLEHSNSIMAQGGIAAAISENDDWKDHFFDTIVAGAYHNHEELTKLLVQKGPEMIQKLIEIGVNFDLDDEGHYALGKEGAHLKRRILHSGGDATGLELVSRLIERVQENVTIVEYEIAFDLIIQDGECIGVTTKNGDGDWVSYFAPHTIIATGGAGQLYEVTSNCKQVTGDGLAIAFRAGAKLVDLEFIQFHPTMLVKDYDGIGLVSEAVRGEGARIVTSSGKLLMEDKHEMKDLAPRDVVAREIFAALEKGESLFLDIQSIDQFDKRFPTIATLCENGGIDWRKGLIPIAPGAHFLMGGIETDQFGQTSIQGLYAVGEVARTGVHGANRLASNSLLEGLVFSHEVARKILESNRTIFPIEIEEKRILEPLEVSLPTIKEIQKVMTTKVGIVRNKESLQEAMDWFTPYRNLMYTNSFYDMSIEEKLICNMLTVGYLISHAAMLRKESRGGHYRLDYPVEQESWFKKKIYHEINGLKDSGSLKEMQKVKLMQ